MIDSNIPKDVNNVTSVIQISTGYDHSCALSANKRVQCWGNNNFGQLGDGTINSASSPVDAIHLNGAGQLIAELGTASIDSEGRIKTVGVGQYVSVAPLYVTGPVTQSEP